MPVAAMIMRSIMPVMRMIMRMVMRLGSAVAVLGFVGIHQVDIPLVLECLHAPQRRKKDSRP